jgi:hypothetical protein
MISEIISHIGVTWRPTNIELVLFHSIFDPVESHINCFVALLLDCVIDNAIYCGVVSFELCGILVVTHFRQCCAHDGAFFCIDKKCTKVGLSHRGDHLFEYFCISQKWAIGWGFLGGACFVTQV